MATLHLAALFATRVAGSPECSDAGTPAPGGGCRCEIPFAGRACAALAFARPGSPGRLGVFAGSADGRLVVGGVPQMTWGGSPIQDSTTGRYHLFFSWFKAPDNATVPTIKWWYNTSVVGHAVSASPDRGYVLKSVLLPPRGRMFFDGSTTHNPTVVAIPPAAGGGYAVYYIGLNCGNYSGSVVPGNKDPGQSECILHQWIGVAHAETLDGPWTRLNTPNPTLNQPRFWQKVLAPMAGGWEQGLVANPAVVPRPDGTLLMAYRGLDDRGSGVVGARSGPFTRLNNGAAIAGPDAVPPTAVIEDMTLWQPGGPGSHHGIHMVSHKERDGANVGVHLFSTDYGLNWTVAGDAYTLTVVTAAGNRTFTRRERPQLLKPPAGVAAPTHLFNGVADQDGFTMTISVPLLSAAVAGEH